jgi:hypothetical protein
MLAVVVLAVSRWVWVWVCRGEGGGKRENILIKANELRKYRDKIVEGTFPISK